jgi:hypothetical protein
MASAIMGSYTSYYCTMQRVPPMTLYIVAPQASIKAQGAVYNRPPSVRCRSGSEPATACMAKLDLFSNTLPVRLERFTPKRLKKIQKMTKLL